jgi:hypothetical protein
MVASLSGNTGIADGGVQANIEELNSNYGLLNGNE